MKSENTKNNKHAEKILKTKQQIQQIEYQKKILKQKIKVSIKFILKVIFDVCALIIINIITGKYFSTIQIIAIYTAYRVLIYKER